MCRSMERMSQQASHTIYRNRSGAAMRPRLRSGAEVPAYDESILQRLQQVATLRHNSTKHNRRAHCVSGMLYILTESFLSQERTASCLPLSAKHHRSVAAAFLGTRCGHNEVPRVRGGLGSGVLLIPKPKLRPHKTLLSTLACEGPDRAILAGRGGDLGGS